DAGCFAGEEASGSSEAGENLIEDQQQLVAIRGRAQPLQHQGAMEAHAAGALHQRLYNDAREFLGVTLESARKDRSALLTLRQLDDVMLGQQAMEARIHALLGIAHRHRPGRIAMVAALEGEEFLALAHALVQ